MKKNNFLFLLFTLVSLTLSAQISGLVQDGDGDPLPGASVIIDGTTTGVVTDFDGNFTLSTSENPPFTIEVSSVGFETLLIIVVLQSGVALDEVLLTGNRSKPRTAIDSAVPIDNIKTSEILNTGEASIVKHLLLQFLLAQARHAIRRRRSVRSP